MASLMEWLFAKEGRQGQGVGIYPTLEDGTYNCTFVVLIAVFSGRAK